MRDITPELVTEYSGSSIQPALLAEFHFDSGVIGMWTGIGQLIWNDITFYGVGNLVNISPIEETQELQARGIVITLNGISSDLISLSLSEKMRGRPFRLYLTKIDTRSRIQLENGTGVIILENSAGAIALENNFGNTTPYRIFSGLMDVMEFTDNGETADIKLSVENILITGKRNKVGRYTHEDQRRRYPSDKGLEFINQLQDKEVVW